MALSYGTNTYAGQAASEFIADMLLGGNTIAGNHITVHPAVKGTKVIQTITTEYVTGFFESFAMCAFKAVTSLLTFSTSVFKVVFSVSSS